MLSPLHYVLRLILSRPYRKLLYVQIFISFAFSSSLMGQGNLLIMPKRVVFENPKRSQELNLVNIGKDTARYVISFIQLKMKDDGTFERIAQPDTGQLFADKYLRIFPRTVTLAPNEAQVVKVQLNKSGEMQDGEYRSHIYFRAVPKETPLGEAQPVKDSSISIKLTPVYGITIPAIIRKGESTAKVMVSDVKFQMTRENQPALKMTFNRTGNMSIYGDVAIDFVAADGKSTRVAGMKGVAVYTPNTKRNMTVLLDNTQAIKYANGKLRMVFSEQVNGKAIKLAEQEVQL